MVLSAVYIFSASHLSAEIPTDNFGVWSRGNNPGAQLDDVSFKGIEGGVAWSEIEPENGVFDWSAMDDALAIADANDIGFICSVNVGPNAPGWLFSNGVPAVMITGSKEGRKGKGPYPYYLNPDHTQFYFRMIDKFGAHIRTLSPHLAKRVLSVQVKTGATGDEAPYKGTPIDPQYTIDKRGPEWRDFRLAAFEKYDIAFQEGPGPKIPLLFNGCGPEKNPAEWNWITTNVTAGLGHKVGGIGQYYQLQDEATRNNEFRQYFINPTGLHMYNRCEMDQNWKTPKFKVNTRMSFYWTALSAIHAGLSRWTITSSAREWCAENNFWEHAEIFNRHASQIFPEKATAAICVFRDGLDSSDTERFPESEYGKAEIGNTQRYIAICKAFASRGAKMDTPEAVIKGNMYQRKTQKGLNDAGWGIFPGNYERFLHQVDANDTSVGWWRVGDITTTSPIYNRFARGFKNSSSKNGIYLDLYDDMSITPTVSFTVTYYDDGTGTWALKYDATSDSHKTALSVTKTNSGDWKKAYVTVGDAYFNNRCPNETDLYLENTDTNDDIFHMVEIWEGDPPSSDTISFAKPTGLSATADSRRSMARW